MPMKYIRTEIALGVYAFVFGATILIGGAMRFSGRRTDVASGIFDWWVWGTMFAVYAIILMLVREWKYSGLVIFLGAVPYSGFFVSYLAGALKHPDIPFTGAGIFGLIWLVHVVVGVRRFNKHVLTPRVIEPLNKRKLDQLERYRG